MMNGYSRGLVIRSLRSEIFLRRIIWATRVNTACILLPKRRSCLFAKPTCARPAFAPASLIRPLRLQLRSASLWGLVHAKTKFACLVCAESTNSCFAGQHRYLGCLISHDHACRVGLASSKREFVTLKRVRKQKPIVGGSRFEGTSVFNSAKSQVNPFEGCAVA